MRQSSSILFVPLVLSLAAAQPPSPRPASPAGPATAVRAAGFDPERLRRIDALVTAAIAERRLPGAVVVVGRRDRVVYRKAFGHRAIDPSPEPMTPDTMFDLASLTKVVATTTSVMQLVEEGRIRLSDRVSAFIPEFGRYGKEDITVLHLLTHVSGLRPDLDLTVEWEGYDTAIRLATEEVPLARPGERFIYSDINFFLLGDIVRRVSGRPLDQYARERIFLPLGMRDTMFRPPAALAPRIAPTERCRPLGWPCSEPEAPPASGTPVSARAAMLRGVVHDPTARRMGGVAGHAGLFSTADDLTIFCRMLLNGGTLGGARVLSPLAVARLTAPSTPPGLPVRALGWDMDSPFSANRGELLPPGSFGHTGWTGTGLWIDPVSGLFVVFLSNRVHPDGKGDVTALRARVSTAAAAALVAPGPMPAAAPAPWTRQMLAPAPAAPERASRPPVLAGIDVLRAQGFAPLKGRRVGLVTNHAGRARDGRTTIDLLFESKELRLVALFSPEHGIRGVLDTAVPSSRDERTGLPIHSLYGETRRPTPEMLDGLDALVVDLPDIGARFYTYMTTMAYVMEEAAKRKLPVIVLDRPNPINGWQIEGPTLDKEALGFTGYFPMPIRHGLTMGELARLFNGENRIGADLTVVPLQNWRRDDWFDETGLPWINPSPNMRSLLQATLYPGIGAIEGTNISVGRGTDTPFEQIGAPWIDGVALAAALNARGLPGIRFYPVTFTPASSRYAGEECRGVFMVVTDRDALRPVRVGLEIAAALYRLYGAKFEIDAAARLFGSREALARAKAGEDPARIAQDWAADEARWRLLRAKYLLYR
ncbi:MAG TPA: exo-beta-N-acetylmuramidase NamZ domain-containing protein [Vicinamibacterales bacterium]|nr:exo-beta-N-acetylmuramidase NamZ domain-containing protein [Vicinamibacterales bacterium]